MTLGRGDIPDWAQKERRHDLELIGENLHIFLPVAEKACKEGGRGAIVVDITSRPTGEGQPCGYFHREIFEDEEDEDIKRMVRKYNPKEKFVILLLKSNDRTSTYRVSSFQKIE